MNRALQWKLIAGFILVFIAGAMTGAFFGAVHARHLFFQGPHRTFVSERLREHLRVQLKLTPEQVAKITPIVDKTTDELEQIRKETGRRVHQTFAEAHRQMASTLTEEQRKKLDQMETRHRRWRHHPGDETAPPEP